MVFVQIYVLVAPYRRVVNPLLKSPLKVRNAFRTTPELHLFAKVVSSFSADSALATGNADFQGHFVPNCKSIDLRANAHNYPGRFMSKGQRRTSTEVAIGKLLIITHIRPADAGGLDLDLKLACRGLFETSGFLYDR